MKKALLLAVVLVFAVICVQVGPVNGQVTQTITTAQKEGEKPGGIVVRTISATAKVISVNEKARVVALKFPDGGVRTFKVDDSVRNLGQVKPGDDVNASYAESVAIYVRKANEEPAAGELRTVQVAPEGAKPGMVTTDTTEIVSKVEAIDYDKRTVTLKGPEGNIATFAVDESVKRFKNVNVGDDVVVMVTNSVMIAVETPAK